MATEGCPLLPLAPSRVVNVPCSPTLSLSPCPRTLVWGSEDEVEAAGLEVTFELEEASDEFTSEHSISSDDLSETKANAHGNESCRPTPPSPIFILPPASPLLGSPVRPEIYDQDISFLCLRTAEHSPSSPLGPLLLLPVSRSVLSPIRRQSAPAALTTVPPSAMTMTMIIDQGVERRTSDCSTFITPVRPTGTGTSANFNSWSGLRRALSVGSDRRAKNNNDGDNNATITPTRHHRGHRRLSSVMEITQTQPQDEMLTYRARQLRARRPSDSTSTSTSITSAHSPPGPGSSLPGTQLPSRSTMQPHGPVPSGPSSPSSPSPSHRDFSLVDGDLFALNFPRPPGRIVSGFSDMDPFFHPILLDRIEQYNTREREREREQKATRTKVDGHTSTSTFPPSPDPDLDYPCDVTSTSHTHTHTAYPPSPTLTPSPHLSLDESPVLKTPEHSEANGSVSDETNRHPSQESPLHHQSTPLFARGRQSSTTKDSLPTETLAKPTITSSARRQSSLMTSREHTRPQPSEGWYSDTEEPLESQLPPSLHPSHPFHHKANPSVPSSTRTTSTLSHPTEHPEHPQPSFTSPPPSYVQLNPSSLSRRQSRFTAFSGGTSSSASSIYSASDTSSVRHLAGHHWGLGEKPDISTVFEEDTIDVDVDLTEKPKSTTLPSAQRDVSKVVDLPSPTFPSKGPVPRVPPVSTQGIPSNTYRYPSLTAPSSATTLVDSRQESPRRAQRSGTISSQVSASSAKSTRSAHPFASAVIRPTSPPPLPSQRLNTKGKLPTSRSQPNLSDIVRSQSPMPPPPAHQVRVASAAEPEEDMCPVCVEPLSSNYRLEGERPHVFPECGHGLHHDCFTHVYGEVPRPGSTRNIGVCGICRQNMRITEGGPGPGRKNKGNKFAALTGQQASPSFVLSSAASIASGPGSLVSPPSPTAPDANGDDPLVPAASISLNISTSTRSRAQVDNSKDVIVPTITIKSEFSSISRVKPQNKAQLLTAMLTVVVPSAPERSMYPAKPRLASDQDTFSPQLPPSPRSTESFSMTSPAPTSTQSAVMTPSSSAGNNPFAHVIADLRKRVTNYNASGLDSLGPLRLFDILAVRKGSLSKDFNVYLFQDALICIQEEKKGGLRGLFSSGSSMRSNESSKSHKNTELALKGRIFLKHVSHVTDTSVPGELTLTIVMVDEGMDAFVLLFKDRGSHETWKLNLNTIVAEARHKMPHRPPPPPPMMIGSSSSSRKIAQMMGADVPLKLPRSASVPGISTFSPTSVQSPSGFSFGEAMSPGPSQSMASQESSLGDLVHIAPLAPVHTPVDVVVILSLPAPSNSTDTVPLKTRLMRESLQFMLATMGSRDRVSFVACEMGHNGTVRKTPFLNPTKYQSRKRLETFIEMLGTGHSNDDEFVVQVQADEKLDVVTAMNVALDVTLQRTVKNPIGSMILVSDTSDAIRRAQMELVTARLDAANLPVHSLGYGRGHDPSPLWMISNHTHGTYTFVKEWYNLRDTLAGVLSGLMSVAVTNMRLHLNCEENEFKILKVAGSNQTIVGRSGKTVEVELRELRFGERREVLVELDLEAGLAPNERDNRYSTMADSLSPSSAQPPSASSSQGSIGRNSALGMDSLSLAETSPMKKVYEDALIDEWPVTEVDCSWHDPGAGLNVHRLNHPVLLTVAILPNNAPPSSTPPDCTVVRRRMEVLASDMITRALLIASRKNYVQALRLLVETKKVIEGMKSNMEKQFLGSAKSNATASKSKREQAVISAILELDNVRADLDYLVEGLEEQREMFERDHRNFAAQQAVVFRDQRSWTTYTESEAHYATPEVRQFLKLSADWSPER